MRDLVGSEWDLVRSGGIQWDLVGSEWDLSGSEWDHKWDLVGSGGICGGI